jgi:hypothetical protein
VVVVAIPETPPVVDGRSRKQRMTAYTPDQIAQGIIDEGRARGITVRGIVIALATGLVETNLTMYANAADPESLNYPHDALGSDHMSDGVFQQQPPWWGTVQCRMDVRCSAGMFYDHLAKLDYNGPNSPGSYAQAVQGSAFPDRYDQRMGDAKNIYDRLAGPPMPSDRPDFHEYPLWSPNCENRGGTPIDLWIIHTEEGSANADQLARNFLDNPSSQVSYHYTISEDPNDHGVTVCDVVDTDQASWSVLSANDRSINLCFAGSSVNWTRDQWLQQSRAIDVAAYLCVQDCRKYGIAVKVIAPPYNCDPPGITDHKYVTQWLGDGTHTDVGPNFPWDVFAAAVNKYT